MKYLLLRLLPKNILSRLLGALADKEVPPGVLKRVIQVYSQFYGVNLAEAKKPIEQMKTFNEFFTRELRPEARPIDATPQSVVSPVDGEISEFGRIQQGMLVQTKGVLYSLTDLVGKTDAVALENGYYLTIYLSPADYHRIHAPVSGKVKHFSYFSGNLWPVNKLGVQNVGALFSLNERIVTPIEGEHGMMALVKVGALIVGKVSVSYSAFETNTGTTSQVNLPIIPEKSYQKGDEIGKFKLGSTVLLIFEKDRFKPDPAIEKGEKVKVGQRIGQFNI